MTAFLHLQTSHAPISGEGERHSPAIRLPSSAIYSVAVLQTLSLSEGQKTIKVTALRPWKDTAKSLDANTPYSHVSLIWMFDSSKNQTATPLIQPAAIKKCIAQDLQATQCYHAGRSPTSA